MVRFGYAVAVGSFFAVGIGGVLLGQHLQRSAEEGMASLSERPQDVFATVVFYLVILAPILFVGFKVLSSQFGGE